MFLPGDRYFAPISVKVCIKLKLSRTWGFLHGDIFGGLLIGGCFFGQFVFDAASATCVVYIVHSCVAVPFMNGHRLLRLDGVPLLLVVVVVGGSRDKLRQSYEW